MHVLEGYMVYDKRYSDYVQVVSKHDDFIVLSTDIDEWKDETRYKVQTPLDEDRFKLGEE